MGNDDIDPKTHGETVIYLRQIANAVEALRQSMATRAEVESVRSELRGELDALRRDVNSARAEARERSPLSWLDRAATMTIKVLTALSLLAAFLTGLAFTTQYLKQASQPEKTKTLLV